MSPLFVLCIFTLLGKMNVNCQYGTTRSGNDLGGRDWPGGNDGTSSPPLPDLSEIQALLRDKEAASRVFKCVLERGSCDQLGKNLKYWAPQLVNGCDECKDAEDRRKYDIIKSGLQTQHPTQWAQLVTKLEKYGTTQSGNDLGGRDRPGGNDGKSPPPLLDFSELLALLKDKEAVSRFYKCVLDQEPCDHWGTFLIYFAPQLVNGCDTCSNAEQRRIYDIIKSGLQTQHPTQWAQLVTKLGQSSPPLPDIIEIQALLTNKEAVSRIFECVLDQEPCDQLGKSLKYWAPQLVNGCDACTEEERRDFDSIKRGIQTQHPTQWAQLETKLGKGNSSNTPTLKKTAMSGNSTMSGCSHFGAPLFFVLGSMLSRLL